MQLLKLKLQLEVDAKLFKEKIYAWQYGPVVKEVYDKFKFYGNNAITLSNYETFLPSKFLTKSNDLQSMNVKFLEAVWNGFKKYTAFELVQRTHIPDSPWYKIYQKYNGNPPHNTIISTEDIREYFYTTYIK